MVVLGSYPRGSLITIGSAEWTQGHHAESTVRMEEAIQLLDRIGNKDILANALPALGANLLADRHMDRAIDCRRTAPR